MNRTLAIASVLAALIAVPGFGQTFEGHGPDDDLAARLREQERELRDLRRAIEERAAGRPAQWTAVGHEPPCACAACCCPPQQITRLPLVTERPLECGETPGGTGEPWTLHYLTDYDNGFVIRSLNPETHPFSLKINGWVQFRHVGFARDAVSWTDNAGNTRPILNRNAFDIERARLVFSGSALVPELTWFLQLDGDTDGREIVDFFDYWWAYTFSDALQIQMGKRKVPGSRQWLLGARSTRLVDRPMAGDFFRPDRTIGLFAVGDLGGGLHYEAMVSNGLRGANLTSTDINDELAFGGTAYWDPLGDYGSDLVDYDATEQPLVRLGSSFSYGTQGDVANGQPLPESDFVRLADGTRLLETGALAPGVTVSEFDVYLLSIDAAAKWRGWSVNAEVFMRWIHNILGNGPITQNELYQRGFLVEGGTFLVPGRLDINARYSQIDGLFGHGAELAAGFNWYPLGTRRMRISFDVSDIDSSPLDNSASEILAGDDGLLFRSQFQAEF